MWLQAALLVACAGGALSAGYCSMNTFTTNTTWMQFTKEPIPLEYGFDDKFKSIHCCVKGYRSIEWFKDGVAYPWSAGVSNLILYPEAANQTLYTRRAARADSGNYTCRLSNETQTETHTVRLDILEKPTDAPRTMFISKDQWVEEGGEVRLYCEALVGRSYLADARSELRWQKVWPNGTEGDLLPTQSEIKTKREDEVDIIGSYLAVDRVSAQDYGTYVCLVHSNDVVSRNYVTVHYRYNNIDADILALMSTEDLKELIPKIGDRVKIKSFIQRQSSQKLTFAIVEDPDEYIEVVSEPESKSSEDALSCASETAIRSNVSYVPQNETLHHCALDVRLITIPDGGGPGNAAWCGGEQVPWRALVLGAAGGALLLVSAAVFRRRCVPRLLLAARHARARAATPAHRARVLEKEFDVLVCWTAVDGELVRGALLPTLALKYKYRVHSVQLSTQPDTWYGELIGEASRCRSMVAVLSPAQYSPHQLLTALHQLRALPLPPVVVLLQDLPKLKREAKECGSRLVSALRGTRLVAWRHVHERAFWTALRLALPLPPPPAPTPAPATRHDTLEKPNPAEMDENKNSRSGSLTALV